MKQQNYLDIYPSSGIAKTIKIEELLEPEAMKTLLAEINEFTRKVEQENVRYLQERQSKLISSDDTYKFFRCQERTRNIRLLLQYLVAFLTKLPLKGDIEEKVVNPFQQLKTFSRLALELLKETDVTEAILKEHEKLGLLNDTNAWYYKGQISKNYKEIYQLLRMAGNITVREYCILFEVLHRLCLFWFSVRNENIKRVRKSDLYIYKLTLLLLHKYNPTLFGS